MPFDYEAYNEKCSSMTVPQLQLEWENYTRQLAGGATSTGCAVLFSPVTAGVSLVGLGVSAPRVQNARKKRDIVEKYLVAQGATHTTRKRDVALPAAISGTLGGLTLGLAGPGADLLGGVAAEKGAEYIISHAALEGAGAVLEHGHTTHEKDKAFEKRGGTPVPVQEQQYEAVPVPPSYSSSQHLPLPIYQPSQQTVQLASTPGIAIVSSSTHNQQAPHAQQETLQQPEKMLYVVGNPESEQPFGLQIQQYPPEKTPAWSPPQDSSPHVTANHSPVQPEIHTGSPMVLQETQAANIQSGDSSFPTPQQSTPLTNHTPPPWSYDFNQWAPPPHGTQELAATPVEQNRTQASVVDQTLMPQPHFISAPRTSNQNIIASQPSQPSQEPSVQSLESSRPDPNPLQSVTATETHNHSLLVAQPPTPIPSHYGQAFPQIQQQQSCIPTPSHLNPPQGDDSQHVQSMPPPPPPRTPVKEQQSHPSGDSQQQHQMEYPGTAGIVSALSAVSLQSSISPMSPQLVVQPPQHHYQTHSQVPASQIQPQYQPHQTLQQQYQTPPPLPNQSGPQYPQLQQYHPTPLPRQYHPPSPQPQYQPEAQTQTQFQYNPSTYAPNPSPKLQQQNNSFALQPTSLHPGSIPQFANAKPTRPVSMLSSLGSTLATSLSNLGSSRPSSPNPAQQQQQQQQSYGPSLAPGTWNAPPTPGSWTGPPSAISPPPGYASPLGIGLSPGPGGQYPLVSPPPAYASPVNGSMVSAGKDYFGSGAVPLGQGLQGQTQQVGVPASGILQQYYAVPPPAGQWGR